MWNVWYKLGYFTDDIQALQLIALVVFGIVASGMLVHFGEISFKRQLFCDIMEYFFIVFNHPYG